MRLLIIVGIAIAVAYWYFGKPSPEEIMLKTRFNIDKGEVIWDGKTIYAEWGKKETKSGYLRYFGRAYDRNVPFMTHDTVLTTGDYSDPDKVYVSEISSGNMFYRPNIRSPEGTLVVLHLFHNSKKVASELSELKQGDTVNFTGREEEDSYIEDDDSMLIALQHNNHKFFLVEEVKKTN